QWVRALVSLSLCLLVVAFNCAAGLYVAGANRNAQGFSIPGSTSAAFYDWVEAILPETVIFFPLPRNESQLLAFADDSLASRITLNRRMILRSLIRLGLWHDACSCGMGYRLCSNIRADYYEH